MNKARVRRVASALLNEELATRKRGTKIGYNQVSWFSRDFARPDFGHHGCGTTACVAGHVTAIYDPRPRQNYSQRAQKILGLTNFQAENCSLVCPVA